MTDSDFIFEGSQAIWNMGNIQGTLGGTYSGSFTFRCFLSPIQQLDASKKYRELIGPHANLVSVEEGYLSYALTQLEKRVIKSPPFWLTPIQHGEMAGSIPDQNVILEVLNAAVRAGELYIERLNKERGKILDKTITIAEEMLQKEHGEEE